MQNIAIGQRPPKQQRLLAENANKTRGEGTVGTIMLKGEHKLHNDNRKGPVEAPKGGHYHINMPGQRGQQQTKTKNPNDLRRSYTQTNKQVPQSQQGNGNFESEKMDVEGSAASIAPSKPQRMRGSTRIFRKAIPRRMKALITSCQTSRHPVSHQKLPPSLPTAARTSLLSFPNRPLRITTCLPKVL